MFTCSKCGGTDVSLSVVLLEELHDKKDGTTAKGAHISEDATIHCETCGHSAPIKVRSLGEKEVTF